MMQKRTLTAGALLLIAAGGAAWAAAGRTVYYHGSAMSSGVTVVNGQPYVPLADVAHALGGKVAPHAGGYEIVSADAGIAGNPGTAGGANEVKGTRGKIGDWFFTGSWRFRVSRVEHVAAYPYEFDSSTGSDRPKGDRDELIVVYCTMKNGHNETSSPTLTTAGLSGQNTALTDDQGQSYPPLDFDARAGSVVPGATKNFAVIFSVPKNTHLHDLIFSVYGTGYQQKITDVRVSLEQ